MKRLRLNEAGAITGVLIFVLALVSSPGHFGFVKSYQQTSNDTLTSTTTTETDKVVPPTEPATQDLTKLPIGDGDV